MIDKERNFDEIIEYYKSRSTQRLLKGFKAQVENFFLNNIELNSEDFPVIHSVRSQIKHPEHLRDKLKRKLKNGALITKENLLFNINDLVGVRVLYLYQDQLHNIHDEINNHKNWKIFEEPKAYTWDPEAKAHYETLGISTEVIETHYTSIHYVVSVTDFFRCPSLDCKTCRGWLTYCAVR